MIRKLLEKQGLKLSAEEFKNVMEVTTHDIKFNNIGFNKKTSLEELLNIAARCALVLKKCA